MRSARAMGAGVLVLVMAGLALADDAGAPDPRLEELYRRLDSLYKEMPAYGSGSPRGGREGYGAEYREAYQRIQEVTNEIIAAELGPELAAKYDEFARNQAELTQQYMAIYQDKSLDQEARNAQLADVRKRQAALSSEYAEVTARANALRMRLSYRRYHHSRVAQLKELLKPSDEEWKVLGPRLLEVLDLQNELRAAASRRMVRMGSTTYLWKYPNKSTPVGVLAEALKKEPPDPADIEAKIDAVRKSRAATAAQETALEDRLKTARQALRELLTTRQEGILVVEDILD